MSAPRTRSRRWMWIAGPISLGLVACQQPETQDLPNRVLDRPTDLVLTCAAVECTDIDGDNQVDVDSECSTRARTLEECQSESDRCTSWIRDTYKTSTDAETGEGDDGLLESKLTSANHLIGFVANSERNEIAMFTKCSDRLVDMNVDTPGYNFVPSGILPTNLTSSSDGCRVLAANVGSCDLTLLDAEALAGFGLGLEQAIEEPSSLVSTLVPERYDEDTDTWVPIGSRPGDIVMVPPTLSTAPVTSGEISGDECDPAKQGSAYVSFPSCNLVAEIDVLTGHVLQSRQFVSDENGDVTVLDTGISPSCPVECPGQFADLLPDDLPTIDSEGPLPQALELVSQAAEDNDETSFSSLFVGGLGSDQLFELRMDVQGEWSETASLELANASGIKRIRVSPVVDFTEFGIADDRRFVYVIVGDGSTRVVQRITPLGDIDEPVGVECDTNRDPMILAGLTIEEAICIPVDEAEEAERRALVNGPGIRVAGGEVTDWVFLDTQGAPSGEDNLTGFRIIGEGVVGIGTTTDGAVVYSMLNQRRALGDTTVQTLTQNDDVTYVDPAQLMDVRLYPHSLWPNASLENAALLPIVEDDVPTRSVPDEVGDVRLLAPSLRRIDWAYTREDRPAIQLGQPGQPLANVDALGGDDDESLYQEDAARIAVHDYRAWIGGAGNWRLEWEGSIPNTASGTGRIDCAKPGWEGGTCLVSEPDDARLLDSAATFCDAGVLPGDKLVLLGCTDDANCGEGRRCLRESAAGGESRGICISAEAYEQRAAELRAICEDFISDPCGEAHREFTITRAFQDELWIQSMDIPALSTLASADYVPGEPCGSGSNNELVAGECRCLPGFEPCAEGGANECCPSETVPTPAPITEVQERFICADEQPEGGCAEDSECVELLGEGWSCVEERCRRPCENADECILRRLPGPTCFGEFIRYEVALRNSFLVDGPVGFLNERVEVDPDTGECRPTESIEISQLVTSRIPLPASDDPLDPSWLAIPECSSDQVSPTDPNPCRITIDRFTDGPTYPTFHRMSYEGRTVEAIRFSNPIFSIVLDLVSLETLTADVPGFEEQAWPPEFARFQRSRIPRGYRQEFRLEGGYRYFDPIVALDGRLATLPMRVVLEPVGEGVAPVVYVVDGSGPGSASGIRGQVVRVELYDAQILPDQDFTGVR